MIRKMRYDHILVIQLTFSVWDFISVSENKGELSSELLPDLLLLMHHLALTHSSSSCSVAISCFSKQTCQHSQVN